MPYRLSTARTEPARSILFAVGLLTLFAGLWIFTPWYVPMFTSPVITASANTPVVISAGINCLMSLPAIYGAFKGTPTWLARGAFVMFLWYVFVTLTRLFLYPFGTLYFITSAIVAMVLSIVYIEQAFIAKKSRVKDG